MSVAGLKKWIEEVIATKVARKTTGGTIAFKATATTLIRRRRGAKAAPGSLAAKV